MELIIAMSLMVITSGIVASIIALNFDVMEEFSQREELLTRGLLAVQLFEREAGMIKDFTNIVVADDQTFRFNDKFANTWEYTITSNNLTRQKVGVGSAMILATPVVNASTKFQYFKGDNTEITSLPLSEANRKLVRFVKFKLVMDDGDGGISLLTGVYPENFKVYNR